MEGDIVLYNFEGCLHRFLFGLEGRAPFAGRNSALTVDSGFTWGVSCDNDAVPPFALWYVAAPSV